MSDERDEQRRRDLTDLMLKVGMPLAKQIAEAEATRHRLQDIRESLATIEALDRLCGMSNRDEELRAECDLLRHQLRIALLRDIQALTRLEPSK